MKRILTIVLLGVSIVPTLATNLLADAGSQFQFAGLKSSEDENVDGFRFSMLYGSSNRMSGFDLGLASYARSNQFEGFGPLLGIGHVTGDSNGCLCSIVNVVEGTASGANLGFLNVFGEAPEAVNLSFMNVTEGTSNVDIAAMAVSKKSKVQVGLLNITGEIERFQIGLLNIAENGIAPVFPLFNMPKQE